MTSPPAERTSGTQVPRLPGSWILSFTDDRSLGARIPGLTGSRSPVTWILSFTDDRSPATWIPSLTGSCRVQAEARTPEPSR